MALTITAPGFPPNYPSPLVGYGKETIFTISGFQPGVHMHIDIRTAVDTSNSLNSTQVFFSKIPQGAAPLRIPGGDRIIYTPKEDETSLEIGVSIIDDSALAGREFRFGVNLLIISPVVGFAEDEPNPPPITANGAEVTEIEAQGVPVTELYVNDELLWKK